MTQLFSNQLYKEQKADCRRVMDLQKEYYCIQLADRDKRIAEFESNALITQERLRWVLRACEIDRDARVELESLLTKDE